MKSEAVRLLKTLQHPCGYFDERVAQNLVIDPLAADQPQIYELALPRGYRRAGGHIYRPACPRCRACTPSRVAVASFAPDRSQRRCLAPQCRPRSQPGTGLGQPGGLRALPALPAAARIPAVAWTTPIPRTSAASWSAPGARPASSCFRAGGRLLAVAVTDMMREGLSSVYTFYEPDEAARGLGTYAIL